MRQWGGEREGRQKSLRLDAPIQHPRSKNRKAPLYLTGGVQYSERFVMSIIRRKSEYLCRDVQLRRIEEG